MTSRLEPYRSVPGAEEYDSFQDDKDPSPSFAVKQASESDAIIVGPPRRMRFSRAVFLGVLPIIASGGLAALFTLWFPVKQYYSWSTVWSQRAFQLDEGGSVDSSRLLGLTIGSVLSEAVSLTSPMVLGLFAFRVAGKWIMMQQEHALETGTGLHALPDPLDYGLILSLMSAPTLATLYQTVRRLLVRRIGASGLLWTAFAFCLYLFGLTHLISLCDLWLHTTTQTIVVNTTIPLTNPLLYGIGFNHTLCPNGTIDPSSGLPCLINQLAWGGDSTALFPDEQPRQLQLNALLIASNSSLLSDAYVLPSVQTLANSGSLAIAVPSQIQSNYSFTAPSFGVAAACSDFTSSCNVTPSAETNWISNCSGAGYPQLPWMKSPAEKLPDQGILFAEFGQGTNLSAFGLLQDKGIVPLPLVTNRSALPYTNPVPLVLQLAWQTFTLGGTPYQFVRSNDAIGFWSGTGEIDALAVFASCNLTWYNITLQQSGGSYFLLDQELSNPAFAAVLWTPLLYQYATPHLESYMHSIALTQNNKHNLMLLLENELARQAMSISSALFMPIDTTKQAFIDTKLLGQYPLAPVVTMFILISSYTMVLAFLALSTYLGSLSPVVHVQGNDNTKKAATVVELTQLRVANPLVLAGQLFSKDPESSLKPSFIGMFDADTTDTAVGIGLVDRGGQKHFEVYNLDNDMKRGLQKSA